ncbi:low molecular weight phosphatase family protein [Dawidia soli]|uniref:Protein-tyrosine-phosphatase n=1 Tax=Dawidia soli TaxID=2782352 RepID=A0AAP2GCG2_9BACT|nr:protein-tyrosine-phosphatase [Dawidia soli]MBT1686269.1 protein-tyrosine-phosphatase [Dawidia soli]
MKLTDALSATVQQLTQEFDQIPAERRPVIGELTQFVREKLDATRPVYLNFICTHNSRRSHLSQIWAQVAAYYYGIPDVHCYSGGTEATAFNPRAVKAMREAGFSIEVGKDGDNPVYHVKFADDAPAITAFSKKYDDPFNHNQDFAAVMTCSDADDNCPVVLGATKRIALRYDDPKEFDGTEREAAKYAERVRQIGREILFAFSQVKNS